ncbi:MAG: hypothetical protein ABSF14_08310 [Terriglobia bacterium]
MNVSKRVLAPLDSAYSLAVLPPADPRGEPAFAAGSETDGGLMILEPPEYCPRLIAREPGGFISLCALVVDGQRFVVASTDFKPVFQAPHCSIRLYGLGPRAADSGCEVARLPYTHRLAVARIGGETCVVASTLCSRKDDRDDWSHPGAIHMARIPRPVAQTWTFRNVLDGLSKNHGMDYAELPGAQAGGYLLSASEGLFCLKIPDCSDGPWPVERFAEGEHSDAFAFDWEGTGVPQVFAIRPFHGTQVVMYRHDASNGNWRPALVADDIEFGHVLWAGRLLGESMLLVGERGGRKGLYLYGQDPARGGMERKVLLDEGIGPAQAVVVSSADARAMLFVSARELGQVLRFDPLHCRKG